MEAGEVSRELATKLTLEILHVQFRPLVKNRPAHCKNLTFKGRFPVSVKNRHLSILYTYSPTLETDGQGGPFLKLCR